MTYDLQDERVEQQSGGLDKLYCYFLFTGLGSEHSRSFYNFLMSGLKLIRKRLAVEKIKNVSSEFRA